MSEAGCCSASKRSVPLLQNHYNIREADRQKSRAKKKSRLWITRTMSLRRLECRGFLALSPKARLSREGPQRKGQARFIC
jgi:hypothetical protein